MNILIEIVRGVAVLVILALFLEMLLPEGGLLSFARLVMGLLLIAVVLNPVIAAFGKLTITSFFEYNAPGVSTEEVLRQGRELGASLTEAARLAYEQDLARQISALVRLTQGVKSAEATAVFEREGLALIIVRVWTENAMTAEEMNALGGKISSLIADFFSTDPKNVIVEVTGGG
ncbi:MAG: stage III sporulation protein AF [Clostridiales bacterium]|nr:stage III sporulation protein AF [Clostridiales bacterium]